MELAIFLIAPIGVAIAIIAFSRVLRSGAAVPERGAALPGTGACPRCGEAVKPDLESCPNCAGPLGLRNACPDCGTRHSRIERFCVKCGTELPGD